MSNRNDYDYYDFDTTDDGYDSREYRRRRPERRQGSYNRRLSYNSRNSRSSYNSRSVRKRRRSPQSLYNNYNSSMRPRSAYNRRKSFNKRRFKNRITIIGGGIFILILVILMIVSMFRGCGTSQKDPSSVSKDIISKQETTVDTTQSDSSKNSAGGDLSPTYFKTPEIKDDNSNGEMVYNIYVWNKTGYELFGSTDDKANTYAETINGFADKLSGITVYDMVIPNHTEFGLPQRLKDGDAPSTSQADNIKAIYSKLSDKVTPVNAYNYLADHNSEYTYFKSDHHWTGLGAYYAYKAFADTNKLTALSLDSCTEKTIDGFTGTFSNTASGLDSDSVHYWEFPYSVTMEITSESGTSTTYDSPYYSGATSGSLTYGAFIMGDNPLTVLKSSSENAEKGKKIAVVKESYGNAFVPYLTNNYEEVHVIDFRTFRNVETDLSSYCKQNGINEVLFLNGVMSANTQIQLDSMSGLFS